MMGTREGICATWPDLRLACPACRARLEADVAGARCETCGAAFVRRGDVFSLLPALDAAKRDIQAFWTDGAVRRTTQGQAGYVASTPAAIGAALDASEAQQRAKGLLKHEIDLDAIDGLKTLEVGCGNGSMSVLLWRRGAAVVAGDLALPRCEVAATKFRALASTVGGPYAVIQLDAERLPFPDDYFDLIVSNGVLHHTSDTEAAVSEVRRVLRSGGRAAIMLYARHSLMFYGLFLWHGLLHGRALRDPKWLSHVTEQDDIVAGRLNPVTRVYSARELRRLFASFSRVSLRKDSATLFSAARFPRLARWLQPLGPYVGWAYCITATK